MKTAILFLFSFIALAAHSQVPGDTLIGKQYGRDSIVKPMMQKITITENAVPLEFTQGAQVTNRLKCFDATYTLTSDSLVLDYSNAGFSTILSRHLSADSPTEVLAYKLLAATTNSITIKLLRAVSTVVNLTNTSVSPFAPAGSSVAGGKVYLSIRGY